MSTPTSPRTPDIALKFAWKLDDLKKLGTLGTILDGSNLMSMPVYQRDYEWDDEQTSKLVTDVAESKANGLFLGSFVLYLTAPDEDEQEHLVEGSEHVLRVVDGQQRITTTLLLMALVRDMIFEYGGGWAKVGRPKEKESTSLRTYARALDAALDGFAGLDDNDAEDIRKMFVSLHKSFVGRGAPSGGSLSSFPGAPRSGKPTLFLRDETSRERLSTFCELGTVLKAAKDLDDGDKRPRQHEHEKATCEQRVHNAVETMYNTLQTILEHRDDTAKLDCLLKLKRFADGLQNSHVMCLLCDSEDKAQHLFRVINMAGTSLSGLAKVKYRFFKAVKDQQLGNEGDFQHLWDSCKKKDVLKSPGGHMNALREVAAVQHVMQGLEVEREYQDLIPNESWSMGKIVKGFSDVKFWHVNKVKNELEATMWLSVFCKNLRWVQDLSSSREKPGPIPSFYKYNGPGHVYDSDGVNLALPGKVEVPAAALPLKFLWDALTRNVRLYLSTGAAGDAERLDALFAMGLTTGMWDPVALFHLFELFIMANRKTPADGNHKKMKKNAFTALCKATLCGPRSKFCRSSCLGPWLRLAQMAVLELRHKPHSKYTTRRSSGRAPKGSSDDKHVMIYVLARYGMLSVYDWNPDANDEFFEYQWRKETRKFHVSDPSEWSLKGVFGTSGKGPREKTSVEHLCPESMDSKGTKTFPGPWTDQVVNSIGNLFLVQKGCNSVLGSKSFVEKKRLLTGCTSPVGKPNVFLQDFAGRRGYEVYTASNLASYPFNLDVWGPEDVKERAVDIASTFASTIWEKVRFSSSFFSLVRPTVKPSHRDRPQPQPRIPKLKRQDSVDKLPTGKRQRTK